MADTYLKRNGSNKIAKVILMRIKIGEDFCRTIRLLLCSLGSAESAQILYLAGPQLNGNTFFSQVLPLLSNYSEVINWSCYPQPPQSHTHQTKHQKNLFFAVTTTFLQVEYRVKMLPFFTRIFSN